VTGSEDIWDVLGTERTSDMLLIRRAYARKLKLTNPEDDAAGFERLRAAFDRAIALAGQTVQLQLYAQRAAQRAEPPPEPASPEPLHAQAQPQPATQAQPAAAAGAPHNAAPETTLQRLQSTFQALDTAIMNPNDRDEGRLQALFAECLGSAALENVQVQLQFERTVANWLLARRPASDILFAEAAARLGWKRRENSVDLPPDIAAVLHHLRDLQFWAKEQESGGLRARARKALQRKPRPLSLRLQMAVFDLGKHVRIFLGEIQAEHGGLASRLDADAISWWRRYFSKPRLSLQWLRPFSTLVPIFLFMGFLIGLDHDAVAKDVAAFAAIAVALIAAILLFKLYAVDWPKHWYLEKYKAQVPPRLRLGWFPAALAALALSAALPSSPWSVAGAVLVGGICSVWTFVVTNDASLGSQRLRHILGYWLIMNFPLLFAWCLLAANDAHGPTAPMWPALFGLLAVERIGRATLLAEYNYGIPVFARKCLPYAIAAAAMLAVVLAILLPATAPWAAVNVALFSIVVVIARIPGLLLSGAQSKARYYVLWLPALVILEAGNKRDLGGSTFLASHSVQVISVWLMAGVAFGMAMVGYNQYRGQTAA
jgi:hypothetical protein